MSKGKYSPALTRKHCDRPYTAYCYNANKQIPPEWTLEMKERGEIYDTRIHFGNYDEDGYDSYGYSAFGRDGNYIGIGEGIDRWGYTEWDYLRMTDDEFENICIYGG
jgi:hypothetical protein